MDGYERRGAFPRALIGKAGEAGLYGAEFPESVGGSDMVYLAATVIQEGMARNDVRFAACNNQQGSTCPTCIYAAGTPEQVMRYVPDLLAGRTIGMMSLTEPGGGSDVAGAMRTVALRDPPRSSSPAPGSSPGVSRGPTPWCRPGPAGGGRPGGSRPFRVS